MPTNELIMYAVLAACAGAYYIYQRRLTRAPSAASVTILPSDPAEWREQWVTTLMHLQQELADEGRDCCVPLVRELIWRLMDGEPNDVPARAPASKAK